jgi:hypothetical protein
MRVRYRPDGWDLQVPCFGIYLHCCSATGLTAFRPAVPWCQPVSHDRRSTSLATGGPAHAGSNKTTNNSNQSRPEFARDRFASH